MGSCNLRAKHTPAPLECKDVEPFIIDISSQPSTPMSAAFLTTQSPFSPLPHNLAWSALPNHFDLPSVPKLTREALARLGRPLPHDPTPFGALINCFRASRENSSLTQTSRRATDIGLFNARGRISEEELERMLEVVFVRGDWKGRIFKEVKGAVERFVREREEWRDGSFNERKKLARVMEVAVRRGVRGEEKERKMEIMKERDMETDANFGTGLPFQFSAFGPENEREVLDERDEDELVKRGRANRMMDVTQLWA
ncbi:hypothetical protein BCR34DRAFT_588905 [Clohesyomyces aquaticus]|uniref:Uncharacterized protein n=1 Tax=Clohesyomyces aquaticus TaxID=1231657 RepID=A0A1Y1ZI84_9PLEO|nr:hypothetical protein BCR34DRAFT_588905 [Clohesyomyces aquaticus]